MRTLPAILTAALALLSIVIAIVFAPGASRAAEQHPHERSLLAGRIDVPDVSRITLSRRDTPTLVFERTGTNQQWNQVRPFVYPMQPFSIRQLAVLAASIDYVGTIDPSDQDETLDAAALGFAPAYGTLTIEHADGRAVTIELGRRGIAGRAYVRLDDDPTIYVVGQSLHDRALGMNPLEWRQRAIFADVSVDATAITRDQGSDIVRLERTGRQWNLTAPVNTRADDISFEDYIAALARAEHGGFIADQPADLARFGLASPVAKLTITSVRKVVGDADTLVEQATDQTLLVGSRIGGSTEDRFGMVVGTPVVVRLPAAMLQSLFRDPRLLADTTASGLKPADIKSIRISGPAGEFRLQRDLEKWVSPDFGNTQVPASRVEELLRQLTTLRAPSLGFDPYPMDQHFANVTFTTFSGRLDTVRIAFDPANGQWKFENGDNVLRVHTDALQLALTPADFGLTSGID